MDIAKRSFEYLLFLLTGTVLFQSLFFFINIGINNVSFILATLLFLVFCYFFRDNKKINKNNFISIIIVWVLIILLFLYYRNFNECTYDGAFYHGNAIVHMLDGWNPFLQADQHKITGVTVWADYYPKATWFFGANLIKLFNNLSAGMIINLLVSIALSVYSFIYVYEWKHKKVLSLIVALVLFLNPIAIEQTHSYYVDAVLGNFTIILIMLCAKVMKEYNIWDNILIVLVSVFMINIKFTGFGFAGIINFVAWVYLFFKNKKGFYKYTVSGVILLFVAVIIVGFSPYLINIIKKRHIFYPLVGENAEDVITYLIPEEIKSMNFYHKFTYSLTSGEGLMNNLKDFSYDEYLLYDEKIGAMGRQFIKIMILSSIGFIYYFACSIKNRKTDFIFWLCILSLIITIIVNYNNMWWFRYIPQIWLFVPIGILLLSDNKILSLFILLILYFVIRQSYFNIYYTVTTDYAKSRAIEKIYNDYKGKDIVVQIDLNSEIKTSLLDDYEVARAKQYGVNITEVRHDAYVEDIKSYYMHYYRIYVLEEK